MSQYSGKCDICDHFMMIDTNDNTTKEDIEKKIKNTNFYIRTRDGKRHHLMINCIRDLVPYYPYLACISAYSNNSRYIELSSCSFVDSEELDILEWKLEDILRYYRKCKRKKINFEFSDYETQHMYNKEIIRNIFELVKNANGEITAKEIQKTIHLPMSEYHRKQLYETMISSGYSKIEAYNWCFNEFVFSEDKMTRLNTKL